MSRLLRTALLLCLAASLLLPAAPASAADPVVEAILFHSDTCPHCHVIIDEFLPPLLEKYGDSFQLKLISIDDITGYQLLMFVDDIAGVPDDRRGVPEMIVGSTVLIGSNSIQESLVGVIDQYLAAGGATVPTKEELILQMNTAIATATAAAEGVTSPTPLSGAASPSPSAGPSTPTTPAAATSTPSSSPLPAPATAPIAATPSAAPAPGSTTTASAPPPIYLAYFFQPGCEVCARAEFDLRLLEDTYPQLVVERYSSVDDAALAEWLGEHYGLPEDQRLVAPAAFMGTDALVAENVTYKNLEVLVQDYQSQGAPRVWANWEAEREVAESRVVGRFLSFGFFTILAAGLIDGVNPCAFATLVFFVSYLSVTGRSRRQVLAAGVAFTLGVFLTYLLIGVGLYRLLAAIPSLSTLGRVIYAITAVACLVLAGFSLYDYLQARRGDTGSMALRLPTRLRRQVNRFIRESMGPGKAAVAALVAGVLVSVVELACTGQVYLPTLMFVAGRPELRANAVGALALYNLAFVVPLIVVFAVSAYGMGSERLRSLLARHTATVKLLTTVLFLLLAVWLVTLVV